MDSKARPIAPAAGVYEDFDPSFEWVRGETLDILLVHLPGFRREQLMVQINPNGYISASGERPLDSKRGSSRFSKDFQVPANCSINSIRAKFENETLHIKFPKLVVAQDDVILSALEAATPPPADTEIDKVRLAEKKLNGDEKMARPASAILGGGGGGKGEAVVAGSGHPRVARSWRLLLMNAGVATLVLLGLGIYLVHKLTKAETR